MAVVKRICHTAGLFLLSVSCLASVWNSPHDLSRAAEPVMHTSFSERPKHLDPVVSYSSNEWIIISQVYEPPLQYNYLKRPYQLEPLTLTQMPRVRYLDAEGNEVNGGAVNVVYSEYSFHLRDDVRYQNHPAFVKNAAGELLYGKLSELQLESIEGFDDFDKTATRPLIADDYVYAIKRMAVRDNHSPILDTMLAYIVGLPEYSEAISETAKKLKDRNEKLDLRVSEIAGVKAIDERHFTIRIKGRYPQFLYWMSMNFFAPVPWEVDLFYQQEGLKKKNLTLDVYPVGTGPYMLVENNPNRRMRLLANPNFHDERYPALTAKERAESSIPVEVLQDAGEQLPFIKEIIFSLEKEGIPLWNKFLQGYYDASGISSEAFDQAVQVSATGSMGLSEEMREKGIQLRGAVQPTIYYMAFNMVDPVVGGYSESRKKLRQAISIAINYEEFISIFMNERGLAAHGPVPPGIFGYNEGLAGMNPVVYEWKSRKAVRKPIEAARQLMVEAGFPNGISAKTGKPLALYYDTTATGPDDRTRLDWMRKQFAKLGIQLIIRATDYNRFQDKVRGGKAQIFSWGWNADYPDPENFLFLLYGGNSAVKTNGSGINSSNYDNPEFNRLFQQMKTMENSPERKEIIEKMLEISREDAPWAWGYHPKSLALYHSWYGNVWPNQMANNTLKYRRVNGEQRAARQEEWNQPVIWPLLAFGFLLLSMIYPLYHGYQQRQKSVISADAQHTRAA